MTEETWRKRIVAACESVGTYKPEFDAVIDTLAQILERRDKANKTYLETGANPIIKHTNKAGAVNFERNPLLSVWCDLNAQALSYWRDLGLTPAGLKKLNENALEMGKKSALESALASIEKDL